MKIMRSFSNVFNVSRSFYITIGQIVFRLSFVFVGFAAGTFLFMVTVGKVIPLFGFDNPLVRYIVIPFGTACLMDKKTFDDKKPYSFLKTVVLYMCRKKVNCGGKAVKLGKKPVDLKITAVRSEEYCQK